MPTSVYSLSSSSSPNLIRYVGVSRDPEKRLKTHISEALTGTTKTHKLNWIRRETSNGNSILLKVITEFASDDEAYAMEVSLISELGRELVNSHPGGVGGFSKETQARKVEALKALWGTQDFRESQVSKYRASWTPERRAAWSTSNKERWTEDYRNSFKDAMKKAREEND